MSGTAPQGVHGQGYLCPRIVGCSGPLATLWYDWFLPETSPDPLQVSQLEELFHQVKDGDTFIQYQQTKCSFTSGGRGQVLDWREAGVSSAAV